MYAIIKTGGKQYRVEKDTVLSIEKVAGDKGGSVTFSDILLGGDGDKLQAGSPLLKGAQVKAHCQTDSETELDSHGPSLTRVLPESSPHYPRFAYSVNRTRRLRRRAAHSGVAQLAEQAAVNR